MYTESTELQKLQGTWREVFGLRGGEDRGWIETLEVKGSRFETSHGKPVAGEIAVDTQKQPFVINFNYTEGGPYAGKNWKVFIGLILAQRMF